MRPTFKRLEVKDLGDLEKLVSENIEGIEPGLRVIDSRLLLGDAPIDLVALDSKGSLVLIALDFAADEGLLLRVMDAYSWCLEYPNTIRRLYPMTRIDPGRPPRILFIVERLTDSFMRRIKQLSFLEIDCLEFRHLEVNGTSALYFDLVQRLRKSEAAEVAVHSEGQAPRILQAPAAPQPRETVTVPSAAAVVEPAPPSTPVIAPPRPLIEAARPVTEPTRPVVESAQAVVAQAPAVPAVVSEPPVPEPALPLEARATGIFAEPAASVVEEPRTTEAEPPALDLKSLDAPAGHAPMEDVSSNAEWQALLSQLGARMPVPPSPTDSQPAAPVVERVVAAAEAPVHARAAQQPQTETPKAPIPPAPTAPAWAKPADRALQPSAGRTYFFAQAVKGTGQTEPQAAQPAPAAAAARASAAPATPRTPAAPAAAAAPAAPVESAAPAAPAAPAASVGSAEASAGEMLAPDRPELESLNFPKDGLSRQWLEFLNQLSEAK